MPNTVFFFCQASPLPHWFTERKRKEREKERKKGRRKERERKERRKALGKISGD